MQNLLSGIGLMCSSSWWAVSSTRAIHYVLVLPQYVKVNLLNFSDVKIIYERGEAPQYVTTIMDGGIEEGDCHAAWYLMPW